MRKRSRPGSARVPSEDQHGGAAWVDGVAFAIFAGYLVLAFTTAFPEQFALPKLLGVYVYTAFCAFRWEVALRRGRVHALDRKIRLPMLALAFWWTAVTLTAEHVSTALFGMRGRYNGLAAMLSGLALLLFIATTLTTAREIEQRLGAICVALSRGLGLRPRAGGRDRSGPSGRRAGRRRRSDIRSSSAARSRWRCPSRSPLRSMGGRGSRDGRGEPCRSSRCSPSP